MKTIAIVGVYVWGALYAAGVFTAGLMWGDRMAVLFAIGCAGAAYVSQFFTTMALDDDIGIEMRRRFWLIGIISTLSSIVLGIAAGAHLIGVR